ncbi:Melanoma-associated antigen B3 [Sciurus carolinensis]|uniref:Melanoma-associated antigen B3 n=1 Tax=Sciurus carolinensis TaxID=30640 RepID=A0AA41NEG5_SCICA|nr:Melanoma-associated antigen B3 [Sciurus carolinensis]
MPRGLKNKFLAREKRQQARSDAQDFEAFEEAAAAAAAAAAEFSSSPKNPPGTEPDSNPQDPERAQSATTASAIVSCTTSDEVSDSQNEEEESSSEATLYTDDSCEDPLTGKVGLLEQFLLYKYEMKQRITKEDMLKVVNQKYKNEFAEIFKRACEHLADVFAVDVREVDSTTHSYNLVSKLKLPNNGRIRAGRGLPKAGLLMNVLGMIFMKGNCASEEDIWKFLKMMHVYPGKKHFIYGEPKKLITKDLVRLKYLVYRQVVNSDPPRHEFLWGPRAHAETSKMQVLEFLAKINETAPSFFPTLYEEALKDEKERSQTMDAAKPDTTAKASEVPKASCPAASLTPVEV